MPSDRTKPEFVANAMRGAAALHEILSYGPTSSPEANKELCEKLGRMVITESDTIGAFLTYGVEELAGEI